MFLVETTLQHQKHALHGQACFRRPEIEFRTRQWMCVSSQPREPRFVDGLGDQRAHACDRLRCSILRSHGCDEHRAVVMVRRTVKRRARQEPETYDAGIARMAETPVFEIDDVHSR